MKWEMRNLQYTSADQQQEYDIATGYDDYIRSNIERGWNVVFPASNQLLIDIDCEAQYQIFRAQLEVMKNLLLVVDWDEKPSDSGLPNRHVVVNLTFDVNEFQRIAFQAAMGSDPARELTNLIRTQHGVENPTTFVERKTNVEPMKEDDDG